MAKSNQPHIRCKKHKGYTGKIKPKLFCPSCLLLFVLRWQHSKEPDKHLGGLNPYTYFLENVKLEEACEGLEVFDTN